MDTYLELLLQMSNVKEIQKECVQEVLKKNNSISLGSVEISNW
jgi:hypothetical protein